MYCLETGSLDKAEYDKMVVKLACSHYYYTGIDVSAVTEAARQSSWISSDLYRTVLRVLSGQSATDEDSALDVAEGFLYDIWRQRDISAQQRQSLIVALLDSITEGRDRKRVLAELLIRTSRRFPVQPLPQQAIGSLVSAWKRVHVV